MEATEQIKRFQDFLDSEYMAEIRKNLRKGNNFLIVDFRRLLKNDPELAEQLLEEPEETIKAAEVAVEQFDFETKNFRIRFSNPPKSISIMIRDVRSKHINKLLCVEGLVRQKSDVRPQVTAARFECPSCGNIITVLQLDKKFREPNSCGCGRKGKFRLISKELVDAQGLVLEEAPEQLEGGEQPKRIKVFLKDDLVSPLTDKKTNPGSKIKIVGILKEVPIVLRTGIRTTSFDLMIEANGIETIGEYFGEIEVTEEEEKKIKELAADPKVYEKMINSIAPSIYGHERVKEALVLQLFGGVRKMRDDGVFTRGDMHVLLIGDPGSAKSQMLKRINVVAPKGRYVSGKGVSGVGLTASVVKDEFLQGWSLEAGALVLANKGICLIDEMDKISKEDRSAIHEALEQQSYHPETEIILSDGSKEKIGVFVDSLLEKGRNKIINGKDCEILSVKNVELLTTDLGRIFPIKVDRVSRHKAPKEFIKITYSNGRSITVTKEHPIFVFNDGIKEVAAEKIREGMLSPAPRYCPTKTRRVELVEEELKNSNKQIAFPPFLNKQLSRLMGYIVSEGHAYYNPTTSYAEVGVSNTDQKICTEVSSLFRSLFNTTINVNTRNAGLCKKATLNMDTIRCCSIPLYKFLKKNFDGMLNKARYKGISNKIRTADSFLRKEFLKTAFKGDGFIDSERFGYSTSSYDLAKGYQDLLMQNGIWSYIAEDRRKEGTYYKTVVSGTESISDFYKNFVEEDDKRLNRIRQFYLRSKRKINYRDPVPFSMVVDLDGLLKEFRLSNGYFMNIIKAKQNSNRKVVKKHLDRIRNKILFCEKVINSSSTRRIRRACCICVSDIAKKLGVSTGTVYNMENDGRKDVLLNVVKKIVKEKIKACKEKLAKLNDFVNSDIRFVKVKKVETVPNKDVDWVYDVTVEPTKTFISEGLVLHNTISISKANIQATLVAETTVLAAANPKFGRFDPYGTIADQIDMPPTLINRFDLIFPIKDLPDPTTDKEMASFILNLHQNRITKVDIDTALLRKFIAYAKQNITPVLTDVAMQEIKDYYIKMRGSGTMEGSIKSVPISPRQLEALVRLSEASARVRLSDKVTKRDAKRAISLLHYCLLEIGLDRETGRIDIDKIATGITTTQRSRIVTIKELIMDLENKIGKTIPIDDLMKASSDHGLKEEEVEEVIEKLKRSGDLFEPKHGFIQRI